MGLIRPLWSSQLCHSSKNSGQTRAIQLKCVAEQDIEDLPFYFHGLQTRKVITSTGHIKGTEHVQSCFSAYLQLQSGNSLLQSTSNDLILINGLLMLGFRREEIIIRWFCNQSFLKPCKFYHHKNFLLDSTSPVRICCSSPPK